jgi:hypothetical protein
MSKQKPDEAGVSEGARRATGEASASSTRATGRWSARRKMSVVLELLRGADLESLSRRHRVTAAKISEWRDAFLTGGEAHLKAREVAVEDEETRRLKNVVADLATEKDLLKESFAIWRPAAPLGWWRSKR